MGRAPCCDKVGLKKGPWTPEEDEILINFIQKHGHSNWRALPKQSGLLRCGKSCRLRWINYLKPDIKRGNFTREEEDTIIQLHEMMGNRWSAIAARLPGRTDNEIKNVWHTHLKKRLSEYQTPKSQAKIARKNRKNADNNSTTTTTTTTTTTNSTNYSDNHAPTSTSPQQSFTTSEDFSSGTEVSSVEFPNDVSTVKDVQTFDNSMGYTNLENEYFPIIDETFWESQEMPLEGDYYNNMTSSLEEFSDIMIDENQLQIDTLIRQENTPIMSENGVGIFGDDNMDFWLDVFVQAGGTPQIQLPEFY